MLSENFVIGGTDQFGQQQDLKFGPNADQAATNTERAEAPMRFDASATEAQHGLAEQARMLPLLFEPKSRQEACFRGRILILSRVPGNERGGTAAVAEFKLLNPREPLSDEVRPQNNGQL